MKYLLIVWALSAAATAFSNDWKTAATQSGLSLEAIEQLQRDGILITDEAYKQVFSAYTSDKKNPVFITSDSLLNAYHVLYEETIFQIENTRASELPEFLRALLSHLDQAAKEVTGNPELLAAARTRAELVIGIALRLLDESYRLGNQELDLIIGNEVQHIEKAEGQMMPPPAWLGEPSVSFVGIDYNRYKPRGFYARTEKLTRYFRALSWLQSTPFRVNNDTELLSMYLMSNAMDEITYSDEVQLIDYSFFLGKPDNPDLPHTQRAIHTIDFKNYDMAHLRKETLDDWEESKINDKEPSYRILSAYCTPSAILFQQTMDLEGVERDLPSGLEVAAALGSSHAKNLLDPAVQEAVESTASEFKSYGYTLGDFGPVNRTLYPIYLHLLKTLFNPPEPDAPDFMKGVPWQTKSLNTALGSWAQMRHTWALQAKQAIAWSCATSAPEGFVEPDPDFFAQMANLAYATHSTLDRFGALEPDYTQSIKDIRTFTAFAKPFKTDDEMDNVFHKLPESEQAPLLLGYGLQYSAPSREFPRVVEWLNKLAEDVEAGKIEDYPQIKQWLDQPVTSLMSKWEDLERICYHLESIAHKQLRTIPLTEADVQLIDLFGKTLSDLMLYEGHAFMHPRDDAPRIVDVYSNINQGQHLQVGISRARKMYVLYPWQGETILCEGAVLPYYEFAHPTRLNDAEWILMLGSRKPEPKRSMLEKIRNTFKYRSRKEAEQPNTRPEVPEWLKPILDDDNLTAPQFID
ncbi:DUF3160 domain-containing protein [Pontiellaceae bacterium B1224]|nr:DUF3160 domain-containing protein [Pontiellaceae bacterium B1224]